MYHLHLAIFLVLVLFSNLIKCDLELCEQTLDYLINSKLNSLLSSNSTYRWNELNSRLSSDLNKCSVIGFNDKLTYNDELIRFNISFCRVKYDRSNEANRNDSSNYHDNQMNRPDNSVLIDFCLPSTCSKEDLYSFDDHRFKQLLNQINGLAYFPNKTIDYAEFRDFIRIKSKSIDALQCTHDQSDRFRLDFYVFSVSFLVVILLIVVSTTIDCLRKSLGTVESEIRLNQIESDYQSIKQPKSKAKIFNCNKFIDLFSILSSINRLTYVDKNVEFNCIYGLKVLSIIWIIVGHSYIYSASIADNYIEFKYLITHQFISRLVINCTFAVDTFFVLSGFLLSYLLFKRKLVNSDFWRPNNLFTFYFNR